MTRGKRTPGPEGRPAARAAKDDARERLRRENEMLRSFVGTSKDALWCIEFAEPVNLTAPEAEIIRQVFENECFWRLCNDAMAQLYKLPEGLDFNAQNVRFVFPRNPENEAFVRELIASEFNVDGALSLDGSYDGTMAYMENDVRAQIEDGFLHRMWGAVRDISGQKKRERDLADRLEAVVNVLSAIPDPVLVVDSDSVLQAANSALEWHFGWRLDDVLGRPMRGLVDFTEGGKDLEELLPLAAGAPGHEATVTLPDGSVQLCGAHLATFGDGRSERRFVITLRSAVEHHVRPARAVRTGRLR
jgi:PAS domain-containing protein